MTWTLSASGTKTPMLPNTCTCTSATPAVVTFANSFAAGDMFFFSGTTAPTGTSLFTPYFISATGLSGSSFQFSLTPGGASINTTSTGTALTCNPMQVLTTDTTNATYVLEVDATNMVAIDILEVRVFNITLSGGVVNQMWKGAWQHAQINDHKISPMIASDQSLTVVISQSAGTARAFPWKLLRI